MTLLRANGLRFLTARAGHGPHLMFLTGTGADLRSALTPVNSMLIDHFDVFTFDQRGLGQSDKPDGPYAMADYADDAVALMDTIGWDRAAVAGYSFGGMVAQEIAIRHPERVSRLALVACAAGGEGGSSYPIHELDALEPYERARLGLMVMDLSITPEWIDANPDTADAMIRQRMHGRPMNADDPRAAMGLACQLAARAEHDTYDRLREIVAPTLVLGGTRDGQALLSVQEAMATQIPDAQLRVIDGSHAMLWENPETLEIVTEFLGSPS